MLQCEECGRLSRGKALGWRALLNGEPGVGFCAACAEREFGPSRREQDRTT